MKNIANKKIGIFGYGNVGVELVKQLKAINCNIAGIFSRTHKECDLMWYNSWKDLVDRADIVIEVIGGIEIAKEIIFYALKNNKIVITANKYLLAVYGKEILPKYEKQINFEASVCGCIPIINLMKNYYKNDQIISIDCILNGTTNYILTNLSKNKSFSEALQEAQLLGLAEKDPSFDINCTDASHKAIILHYLAFNEWFNIDKISINLPKFAKQGERSVCKITKNNISIQNTNERKFNRIVNCYNALLLNCKLSGESFISGIGAGGSQTAFAIICDYKNL